MFTEADRDRIRTRLLERAQADSRISGAALTGSAAGDVQDRWSDIDLFFGVRTEIPLAEVLDEWSAFVYEELGALHHFDLWADPAIYRAFLLPACLEVDLAFTPASDFGARGPHFRPVFGTAVARPPVAPPDRDHLIGLAWHHVLHARMCIERNRVWQAEYWISAVRDQALALACLRFGQPTQYAKGVDGLPAEVTAGVEEALVRSLTRAELGRALGAAVTYLRRELWAADAGLAKRLEESLGELAAPSAS